jgi:hypothetical protein
MVPSCHLYEDGRVVPALFPCYPLRYAVGVAWEEDYLAVVLSMVRNPQAIEQRVNSTAQ